MATATMNDVWLGWVRQKELFYVAETEWLSLTEPAE